MTTTISYWKNIKIKMRSKTVCWLLFWFCILGLLTLAGCTSKPTVSTAQTAVKVDAELAKLDLIKTSMLTARQSINENALYQQEPPPPEPLHLITLDIFLRENNCELYFGVTGNFDKAKTCYMATVLRLINETNNVDILGSKLYEAEFKNYLYWRTLNGMFDALEIPKITPQ